ALASAPARTMRAKLSRLVPFNDLVAYNPPEWLYTSGKPNRCNPSGVLCVYFGEDADVAATEYEARWKQLVGKDQPVTTYYAMVALQRVLDLTSPATLNALGVDQQDLFKPWRRAKRLTLTQLLGKAVNETRLFSAIRFPSKAAARAGVNIVIFRNCLRSPDSVQVLGPTNKPLERWP
ncbi:MAG TPA: RES family NAD+ phosphorylase, partial [Dongiaceae bacterium]|nr:RES family NAD+ phosphorylase [Dongiaceae bacterium]